MRVRAPTADYLLLFDSISKQGAVTRVKKSINRRFGYQNSVEWVHSLDTLWLHSDRLRRPPTHIDQSARHLCQCTFILYIRSKLPPATEFAVERNSQIVGGRRASSNAAGACECEIEIEKTRITQFQRAHGIMHSERQAMTVVRRTDIHSDTCFRLSVFAFEKLNCFSSAVHVRSHKSIHRIALARSICVNKRSSSVSIPITTNGLSECGRISWNRWQFVTIQSVQRMRRVSELKTNRKILNYMVFRLIVGSVWHDGAAPSVVGVGVVVVVVVTRNDAGMASSAVESIRLHV